jgi:hypothetical protein
MALVVDSEMTSNAGFGITQPGSGLASPQTFSFTNTAGTVLYMIVGFGQPGASTAVTFGTVSYNSVSMTKIVETTTSGSTTGGKIALYRLLTPATGANTVSIAFTGDAGAHPELWAGCISFTGNNTVTPEAQSGSSNGSSANPSITLTAVVSGNISVAGMGGGSTITAQDKTLSWVSNVDEFTAMGNGRSSRSAASGSVAHGFTMGSDSWAAVAVEVAAAASAASSLNMNLFDRRTPRRRTQQRM